MEKEKALEKTLRHVAAGAVVAGVYVFNVPTLEYLTPVHTAAAGLVGVGLTAVVEDLVDGYRAYRRQPKEKK